MIAMTSNYHPQTTGQAVIAHKLKRTANIQAVNKIAKIELRARTNGFSSVIVMLPRLGSVQADGNETHEPYRRDCNQDLLIVRLADVCK